ncbi:hypothetical protein pipiens_002117 [Culex pipiens pipiens]|uniref:B box-type domain-containing protein n=3 Tax=Culex pipiens TaxID=7175 RepID=A0ABD1DKY1_CULPP
MNPILGVDKNELGRRRQKVQIDALDTPPTRDSPDSDEDGSEGGPGQNRYVRLREEHVEAVVILRNSIKREDLKGINDVESLWSSNGKLTFNLTPEQLGGGAGGGLGFGPGEEDKPSLARKSSLRRNSLYSNQLDLEKRLQMELPKPVPELGGMYDVPQKILMPMFCEDQDWMDMNSFQDKNRQPKFDEILTVYDQFPTDFLPSKYICGICGRLCQEPRVLDCLHSFCKRCLIEQEANAHSGSNLFWRRINESGNDGCGGSGGGGGSFEWDAGNNDSQSQFSQSSSKVGAKLKAFGFGGGASVVMYKDPAKEQLLVCPSCGMATELPLGGVNRLPPHFVMARKIEDIVSACGNPPPNVLCELCTNEVAATSACSTCSLKLCNFCKEAHQRQRSTSTHVVRTVGELLLGRSRAHRSSDPALASAESRPIKCPMHPEHQLKLFCTTCHQVICPECTVFIHRDHKHTSAAKAAKVYSRFVKGAIEQTRPLEDYAMQSVGRLNDMSIRINSKCEAVQRDVEAFMDDYVAALEEHRRALLRQIADVRQAKTEMLMAQKGDLEQRSQNARAAIDFAEEIINEGNEIENLVFVSILLKRFEQCLRSNRSLDCRVTDTLEFLPEERTPCVRLQNRIPLYGVVTTQKVDPRNCSLDNCSGSALAQGLKVHRRVEMTLVTKDYEGKPMTHGGILVEGDLRYRDEENRPVTVAVTDSRDGTYQLSFMPERAGVMALMISVDGKLIEDCPYVLRIHNLRPHRGVYHCCSFCSSNGSKYATCACGSVMPGGYRGCGHGHEGHPGQRHWSCCGSVQEHSDCAGAWKKAGKGGGV